MKKSTYACTLDCFDACKFNVYSKDNKVLKMEGDSHHPYTKGFTCKKGLAHMTRLTHPNRLKMPLLKVTNPLGETTFKEIPFEAALNLVAEKIDFYKENFGPTSILYYEQYGNGGLLKSIGEIFFNTLGGATQIKGGPCWSAGIAAQREDFGNSRSHSLSDMLNSKAIFVWGKNPAVTTIHTMQMLKKAKAQGIPIIVIDPIKTATAKFADYHIQIKPKGDAALALALGKFIIENHLYDAAYIHDFVNGFAAYKDSITHLDLEVLLTYAGINYETLVCLAKLYTQKYTTILLGYGLQKYYNGGATIRLIDALGAITGQIGFSGGGINYANKVYPGLLHTDPYDTHLFAQNRMVKIKNFASFITAHTNESTLAHGEVPLKMAIITKSNLLNQLSDLNTLTATFKQIPFKVCFEQFMTDTAKVCDLIIPASMALESEDLLFSSMTNPYLTYNEQAILPEHPLMDEYHFFAALAQKLKLTNYPQVTKTEYLEKVLLPLKKEFPELSLDYLKTHYFTCHQSIAWENKVFETPSKRIELITPDAGTFTFEKPKALRLITTHSKDTLFSQHIMDSPTSAKVYMHSETANHYLIKPQTLIQLASPRGAISAYAVIDDTIPKETLMMHAGWWKKHGNPNYLTVSDTSDFGNQIAYHETFVTLKNL